MPNADFDAYLAGFKRAHYAFLPNELATRLARDYGTRAEAIVGAATGTLADLGEDFGAGPDAAEVDYLVAQEWAQTSHGHPVASLQAGPASVERWIARLDATSKSSCGGVGRSPFSRSREKVARSGVG